MVLRAVIKWLIKILIILIPWVIWEGLTDFPIPNDKPFWNNFGLIAVLMLYSIVVYTINHSYKFLARFGIILIPLPFLFFFSLALASGIAIDRFGDPKLVEWSAYMNDEAQFILIGLVVTLLILPYELAHYSYSRKKRK